MARNCGFTRENVQIFLENLQEIMERYHFDPSRIFNLDETGLSTVLQPPKVIASKKSKQVGKCVTAERGESITICAFVNAAGESFPPVYLFPRKRNHPEYMDGCLEGSVAFFNEKGYMDAAIFVKTLEHFKAHTAASKDNEVLLILDNHGSHLSLEAIKYCRDNGIHMVTLPPHTSHRTQPLDLTVFGPFKMFCARAFDSWMSAGSGNRINLHNIVRISKEPLQKCMSSKNIKAGFMKSGIYPMDSSKLLEFFETPEAASSSTKVSCTVLEDNSETIKSPLFPRAMNSTAITSEETDNQDIIPQDSMLPVTLQETSSQINISLEASLHENVSHDITPQDFSSHETTFQENMSQMCFQDLIVEESVSHENIFEDQSLNSPDNQALDLSVSTRNQELRGDNRGILAFVPISNLPLDLSLSSSNTFAKPHASQLRFGGLEIIRPLPTPPTSKTKQSRGMTSIIATSSPELKKKEDLEISKRVKQENKRNREEKKNQERSTAETGKRKILPEPEVLIPGKKKRGRPRKVLPVSDASN